MITTLKMNTLIMFDQSIEEFISNIEIPHNVNPIPRGLKYNLFHAGGGHICPPRDFALAKPMMDEKLCQFIQLLH